MYQLLEKIKKYETIIIHRHTRPDLDAIGSQHGLAEIIRDNFINKKVFCVGDENKFSFLSASDTVEDELFHNALCIITDVAVGHLVSDERYRLSKEVFVIDHHTNACDITENYYINSDFGSACEYIATMIYENNFNISSKAATCLAGGMITDTGRFLYKCVTSNTFLIMSKLISDGADIQFIYDNINIETLETRNMKNYFLHQIKYTKNFIAYLINDESIYVKFPNTTCNDISRGMVSIMSGVEEVKIWVNFTFDNEQGKYICEIRSRDIIVVDIAKKYLGGGHNFACGCTVNNLDEVMSVLLDLDNLMEAKNV